MIEKTENELFKMLEWIEKNRTDKFNKKICLLIRNYCADVSAILQQQQVVNDIQADEIKKLKDAVSSKPLRNNITGALVGYFSSNYQF
jgi:hypothetical protein